MINLFYNELIKALYKRRTYISFILITLLIPVIVYAIDYGAISLQNKIYAKNDWFGLRKGRPKGA